MNQCQPNLEQIESEFLTSALLKLVSDNNFVEELPQQEIGNEILEPSQDVETNIKR